MCKDDGSNSRVPRFCSPSNSFFDTQTLASEHVWINAPFHLIEPAIKHYLALKARSPDTTSACILVPRWPGARWNRLLQGMQVIQKFEVGFPLFKLDRPGTQNTSSPMIPWPVDIYYDPSYEPHAVKTTHSREQAAPLAPAMHFKAAVSGTPAVVALDSQATHCFIDKQYAQAAGIRCTPAHRMVQLADGSHTQISGECNLYLKIFSADPAHRDYSGRVPCLVIDLGEDHNLILGQDWLKQEGAVLSFHTDTCTLERRNSLVLKPVAHTKAQRHIKPTLSAARALKAIAKGCKLLEINVQAILPGPPPLQPQRGKNPSGMEIPDSVSPQVRDILVRHAARQGVRFHMRHRWLGFGEGGALRFAAPSGESSVHPGATVLALGGASWPQLGSDGAWVPMLEARGVDVAALRPSNCGFDVAWSEHFASRHAGQPLKGVALAFEGWQQAGECVVTAGGVEGSLVYAASALLREALARRGEAVFHLDLLPQRSLAWVAAELAHPRGPR